MQNKALARSTESQIQPQKYMKPKKIFIYSQKSPATNKHLPQVSVDNPLQQPLLRKVNK